MTTGSQHALKSNSHCIYSFHCLEKSAFAIICHILAPHRRWSDKSERGNDVFFFFCSRMCFRTALIGLWVLEDFNLRLGIDVKCSESFDGINAIAGQEVPIHFNLFALISTNGTLDERKKTIKRCHPNTSSVHSSYFPIFFFCWFVCFIIHFRRRHRHCIHFVIPIATDHLVLELAISVRSHLKIISLGRNFSFIREKCATNAVSIKHDEQIYRRFVCSMPLLMQLSNVIRTDDKQSNK